jgi:hypothetical protein
MSNITSGKNKVFFASKFGIAPFYFYTFIGLETGWGGSRVVQRSVPAVDVFRKRGKLPIITVFTGRDGFCRPFFISCRSLSLPLQ